MRSTTDRTREDPPLQSQNGIDNSASESEKSIPVMAENYSVSKKVTQQEFVIEKRWVTTTKTIQVPIRYEEIYVNGKRFGAKSSIDSLIGKASKLAGKDDAGRTRDDIDDRQLVPLIEGEAALQKLIPLYGEQVTISRRMVKLQDAIITKARVQENQKVTFRLAGERITILYPDGTERTLDSTAAAPHEENTAPDKSLHTSAV